MADNERIQYTSDDIGYQQYAQSGRTNFCPGKASASAGSMNWEKDYRIPTGTPAFDESVNGSVKVQRVRVVKLNRNIVSDQNIPAPQLDGSGDAIAQDNDGIKEKTSGYDWLTGS